MTLRRKRRILPQNSAHRLRQSGEAPTHIVCSHARTRRHVISLPRCRKCYVLPRRRIAPLKSGLTPPILLLQQESERHLPGADVLYSQQCATLFTLAVRDWLSQAGTA